MRRAGLILGGLVCLVLVTGFAVTAGLSYVHQVEDAERQTQNLALALDEHAQRTFRVIELTLQATARALGPFLGTGLDAQTRELGEVLDTEMTEAKEIVNLSILGPNGKHVVDARRTPGVFDYHDDPIFSVHRTRSGTSVFLSDPIMSRTGRGWVLIASRRLDRPGGGFAGVVTATVSVNSFLKFYGTLSTTEGAAVTLRNRVGIIIARHPANIELIGKKGPSSAVVDAVRLGRGEGTLVVASPLGVTTRITSFRAVEGTPFIVSVGASGAAMLQDWAPNTFRYGLVTLALIAIIAGLVWGVTRQVARRLQSDREARESEEAAARASRRLADAIEALPAAFLLFDADDRLIMVNRSLANIFPQLAQHFVPGATGRCGDVLQMAEQLGLVVSAPGSAGVVDFESGEHEVETVDGRWIQVTSWRTSDGGRVCIYVDITERKALLDVSLRAQKLETLGQLTGGVAHDFNNLLTVILGNSSLLGESLDSNPALRGLAKMIEETALRGAALTHRLLAFARQQPLQPAGVDLNALVTGMEELLRRTLGEDIDIIVHLAKDLPAVLADAGQVENALLNLIINSRDAMPAGGTLTIETAVAILDADYAAREGEVAPGSYAMLVVTDTGTGMTAETQRKAFEPFFTTKDIDKGTGLGLSMVFGFAKQSGGHVKLYSELGVGTTIRLYLPWASALDELAGNAAARLEAEPSGNETILVVEDDEAVRVFAVTSLRRLGYAVHEARDGQAALALLTTLGDVDLLFTDIGLPGGMNGRQLVEKARRRQPGLRVLYTSGYSAEAIVHQGRLDPGVLLLSKPYRMGDLARRVQSALTVVPLAA